MNTYVPQVTRGRIASPDVQRAIVRLIDYMAADEFNHFMGEPDHIWHTVRIVRDWIGLPKFEDEDAVMAELEASGPSTAA